MNIKTLKFYICAQCDEKHEDSYDAQTCCSPITDTVFVCPHCENHNSTEAAAVQCCASIEEAVRLFQRVTATT